mgnify:CR=1 FL=1
MKRAGLKDKISFIVNRYDSKNAISVTDVTSILNMTSEDKMQFESFKIPNDYNVLGKCWNYCELASKNYPDSLFIKKLDSILQEKNFYKKEQKKDRLGGGIHFSQRVAVPKYHRMSFYQGLFSPLALPAITVRK